MHEPVHGRRYTIFGLILLLLLLFLPFLLTYHANLPCPLQPGPLPGPGLVLFFPDLSACLHQILDDAKLVVHQPSVPELAPHTLVWPAIILVAKYWVITGWPGFWHSAIRQLTNRSVSLEWAEEYSLEEQVVENLQLNAPVLSAHFGGSDPDQFVEPQPGKRCMQVCEEHLLNLRLAILEDLRGKRHSYLKDPVCDGDLKFLYKMLYGHSLRRATRYTLPPFQKRTPGGPRMVAHSPYRKSRCGYCTGLPLLFQVTWMLGKHYPQAKRHRS